MSYEPIQQNTAYAGTRDVDAQQPTRDGAAT